MDSRGLEMLGALLAEVLGDEMRRNGSNGWRQCRRLHWEFAISIALLSLLGIAWCALSR
jgi:hypothetical protein